MAVMSRKKKAVAQRWDSISSQRDKGNQSVKDEDKPIDEEEHKKRVEILKSLGLLKDE
jgi:hypothetical protein